MHGNKAAEISIQCSLKSLLPPQNVRRNHHTLYHQQSYFSKPCDDDTDHDCVKACIITSDCSKCLGCARQIENFHHLPK